MNEKPEYKPPRNALREISARTPSELRSIVVAVIEEATREHPTGEWPDVPYHYGMGRIMAYDRWLGTLTEEERKAAIRRSREVYEAYYQECADLAISKLKTRGIDVSFLDIEPARTSHYSRLRDHIDNGSPIDMPKRPPETRDRGDDFGRERYRR